MKNTQAYVVMLNDTPQCVFTNVTEEEAEQLLDDEREHYKAQHPHTDFSKVPFYWRVVDVPHRGVPLQDAE